MSSRREAAIAARPRQRRGAVVEERILDVTVKLLSRRGYEFTIDEVAEEAGVHKTTVYRRWATKPQLVAAAFHHFAEAAVDVRMTGDVRADLRRLAIEVARALRSPTGPNALRATLAAAGSDRALIEVARDFFAVRYAEAVPLIRNGVDAGVVRDDVDPVLLWQAIVNPMHLDAICGVATSDARARALVDLVLDGAVARRG